MLIDLEELNFSPEKRLDIQFNEYIADLNNSVDVIGNTILKLTPYGVNITGTVSTELELICDRCLKVYTKKVTANINEDFVFGTLIPKGTKEYELQAGEFVTDLNGQLTIDLTEIVYQLIVLEIPNQNLCAEDCKGTEELQVIQKETKQDPRLEMFKNLLQEEP